MCEQIFDTSLTNDYSEKGKLLVGKYIGLIDKLNKSITEYSISEDINKMDLLIKNLQNITKLIKDYLSLEIQITRTEKSSEKQQSIFINGAEIKDLKDIKKFLEELEKEKKKKY